MVKKILVSIVLAFFISSCFAGYSSGGRSGFSGGSKSYSSSSYSSGRSGYSSSRSITTRSYVQPRTYSNSRSYSGSSANTVIHNNHYGSSGGGLGIGGGFLSGMLGGYLGGSLANSHHTTVVAGAGAPMVAQGQGMLMDGAPAIVPVHNPVSSIIGSIIGLMFAIFLIWLLVALTRHFLGSNQRNRW